MEIDLLRWGDFLYLGITILWPLINLKSCGNFFYGGLVPTLNSLIFFLFIKAVFPFFRGIS